MQYIQNKSEMTNNNIFFVLEQRF